MARGRRPQEPKEHTVQFWDAPEVRKLAQEMIPVNHRHLEGKPITYVFCAKSPSAKGCKASGVASIIGGVAAALSQGLEEKQVPIEGEERFFLIRISKPVWNNLSDEQKRAIVDHELSHCGISPKGGLTIWPHDIEEFQSIVHRHGFWWQGLKKFGEACVEAAGQTTLEFEANGNGKSKPEGRAPKPTGAGAVVPAGDRA